MRLDLIRKLAKRADYQMLYNRSKEMFGIKLFNNEHSFTNAQLWFLHYLELYSGLYQDIYMKEPHINEDILDDDLRVDAYLLYKQKTKDKTEEQKEKDILHDGAIVFKSRPKG